MGGRSGGGSGSRGKSSIRTESGLGRKDRALIVRHDMPSKNFQRKNGRKKEAKLPAFTSTKTRADKDAGARERANKGEVH